MFPSQVDRLSGRSTVFFAKITSKMSCPIEQHRRSAIYVSHVKMGSTSRTLNRTYSLMVLWPRIEWYTLLASNSVMQKYVRTINSPFNKSTFSEGCNFLILEEKLRVIPWPIKRTSRKLVP